MHAKVSYQTLYLPPPFAYAYTLEFDFDRVLHVIFQLEYLNRDALTPEEIESEGFTQQDDFRWEGSLDPVWKNTLEKDLLAAKTVSEGDNENIWIHLETSTRKHGILSDTDEWDFRLQEVIQAIYEVSGRERPLLMKFMHRHQGKPLYYELKGYFATRSCTINDQPIPWQRMQSLLSEVFSMDLGENAKKIPDSDGLWIDPDGLSGYHPMSDLSGKGSGRREKRILDLLSSAGIG